MWDLNNHMWLCLHSSVSVGESALALISVHMVLVSLMWRQSGPALYLIVAIMLGVEVNAL